MSTTTKTIARLFVTDYASYNNGTQFQFGHWVNLSDFNDAEEFIEYITNHLAEADKTSPIEGTTREEIMFTDFEGFPKSLYHESMSITGIEKIFNYLALEVDSWDDSDWLTLHNEYCDSNRSDDHIYSFDETFFDMFYYNKPMHSARAVLFGDVNWSHDYVQFNGYGNLETSNSVESLIDEDTLIEYALNR